MPSTNAMQPFPERRTTPMAPMPCGVARATMISFHCVDMIVKLRSRNRINKKGRLDTQTTLYVEKDWFIQKAGMLQADGDMLLHFYRSEQLASTQDPF